MFWLKKAVALLISPLFLILAALIAALVVHRFSERFRRPARWGVALSTVALLAVSTGPLGEVLLAPLERAHPAVSDPADLPQGSTDEPMPIIVLGGGYRPRQDQLATSELTEASLVRLNEGLRLYHALEHPQLVLSGDAVQHPGSTAQTMAHLTTSLGIDADPWLLDRARDTAEEAQHLHQRLQDDGPRSSPEVIVVTSASHMPRARRLFERQGFQVHPAPTHFLTGDALLSVGRIPPSSHNIRRVERALYEALGLTWVALGGS